MTFPESDPFGQCLAYADENPEIVLAGSGVIFLLTALFKLALSGNKKAAKKFLEVADMHKKKRNR